MLENIPANMSWMITLFSLAAAVIAFAKFWFNRGSSTTAAKLERKNCINKIRTDVESLKKEFEDEKNGSIHEHETFKESMHKVKDKIILIENDVAYIKGKIDAALKHR